LGDRIQLHPFPTTVELLLNRRTTRKQIRTTTRVASPDLGFKTRVITPVLQEITIASMMTHEISSMPSVTDDMRTDRFPAFNQNVNYAEYSTKFNPVNMQNLKKYDGKQDPRQWLRIYSTTIEVVGGTNSTKVIYFLMALESAPLNGSRA